MATWNNSDYDTAISKAGKERLSPHEENKLEEASHQAGSRGNEARIALERNRRLR